MTSAVRVNNAITLHLLVELLPVDPGTQKHAWTYHKNKRYFKNSTTSSDCSSLSWLTGTSSYNHNKANFMDMKAENHEKVLRGYFMVMSGG